MKVKFGALIVEGRGKLAGWVLSRNRGGAYARQKVTPLNPATASQSAVRNALAGLSSGWRALTAAQRQSWNDAVQSFQKTDIFGDLKTPSGKNLYTSINRNIQIVAGTPLTSPPVPTAVSGLSTLSVVADVSDDKLEVTYTPAIPAAETMLVYATPPLSPGVSFVKSEYRYVTALLTADASPIDIITSYKNKFGSIGSAGQKIFVKCVHVNTVAGVRGIARSTSTIVVA